MVRFGMSVCNVFLTFCSSALSALPTLFHVGVLSSPALPALPILLQRGFLSTGAGITGCRLVICHAFVVRPSSCLHAWVERAAAVVHQFFVFRHLWLAGYVRPMMQREKQGEFERNRFTYFCFAAALLICFAMPFCFSVCRVASCSFVFSFPLTGVACAGSLTGRESMDRINYQFCRLSSVGALYERAAS